MKRSTLNRYLTVCVMVIISASLGYFFGTHRVNIGWKNFRPVANVEQLTPPSSQNLDFTLLYESIEKVNEDYYDKSKIDPQELVFGAVSGMLASLDDPYTSFLPPAKNEEFKEQLAGEFSGIGAELSQNTEKRIVVVAPLDDSPAERAGIKAGDIIVRVNGEDISGWTLPEVVEKIRGPKGTKVKLTVLHEGNETFNDYEVTRDTIVIKSVRGWYEKMQCDEEMCKKAPKDCTACESIAYVRLSQFGDKTNQEWVEVLNDLFPQFSADRNFKGLVLDLRNNPGGYLTDAVFIASEFIPDGLVVAQEDGKGNREELNVNRKGVLLNTPVIVLVNKGSASASEIVSGALRDRRGIPLLGENSFGKGTVQEAYDVTAGASIHLSVAKWLTPNNTWVHETGLTPDITVELDATKSATMQENGGYDNQLDSAIRELLQN